MYTVEFILEIKPMHREKQPFNPPSKIPLFKFFGYFLWKSPPLLYIIQVQFVTRA
jgi:hypothetical protein